MAIRQTHTYATLEVSAAAYDEVASKLKAADYGHAFMPDGEIDMHGIALTRAKTETCVHGVADGVYCEPCNKEYKRAAKENGA